jgi:inosine/xanthosine triphosphate pyrophosphatase family protein
MTTDREIGWEPIFEHEGETLAEMEKDKKVQLSNVASRAYY